MALIVAGDRSGVGKTTITLAILAFLTNRGLRVQSFKVGPDYIDPMFHSAITGIPCRNLDPVLTSANYVRDCFQRHGSSADAVVIEGVMGLFDGIVSHDGDRDFLNDWGSTAHIARILDLPVALVLDCSRMSSSIAAIAYGYAHLDPKVKIAGVILNQVASERHLELLETALDSIKMPILGVFRRNSLMSIPDRHLGLIPTNELPNIQKTFKHLSEIAKQAIDWDKLFPLISQSRQGGIISPSPQVTQSSSHPVPPFEGLSPLGGKPSSRDNIPQSTIKIAIARDPAFNFYYQDNLDLLTELGAELIYWSPINDQNIPQNIQGMYFGGGFPEIFAQQLAENKTILQQLKQIIASGIPTYAECGGLMYLCEKLIDLQGNNWEMVGVIPSTVTMKAKLTLGYRQAIALKDSCLINSQQTVTGHEFHRSQLLDLPDKPQWQLQGFHKSSPQTTEGWQIANIQASYLHLHWGETTDLPRRFIDYCQNYKSSLY